MKGAFDVPRHKKMEQQKAKDEKMISDWAKKIWGVKLF